MRGEGGKGEIKCFSESKIKFLFSQFSPVVVLILFKVKDTTRIRETRLKCTIVS